MGKGYGTDVKARSRSKAPKSHGRGALPRPAEERIDVGARLKQVRLDRKLSQRDLADRSGVTNGMISMIEQNKHSPSVATMNRITDALGMSFADFFSLGNEAEAPKVFFRPDELTRLVEGKLELRVVAGNRRAKALQILHEIYQPGGDTGPEMLSHEGEEGGIVVSGEVEITVGEQCLILGPGDAYYFESEVPHRFRNVGAKSAVIISACTPPSL